MFRCSSGKNRVPSMACQTNAELGSKPSGDIICPYIVTSVFASVLPCVSARHSCARGTAGGPLRRWGTAFGGESPACYSSGTCQAAWPSVSVPQRSAAGFSLCSGVLFLACSYSRRASLAVSGSLVPVVGGLFPSPLGFGLGSFFLARLVCLVPARGLPGIGKVCWNKILLGDAAGRPSWTRPSSISRGPDPRPCGAFGSTSGSDSMYSSRG